MPRFFFDITDGDGFHRDDIGDEYASIEEARMQCQTVLPDIVRDEAGRVVYSGKVTFIGTWDPQ